MTERPQPELPLTCLQITDVHLRARPGDKLLGVDTWASLNAVLDQALAEHHPDALLVTGDIAHDPEPQVYQRFFEHLAMRFAGPVLAVPGNHDVLAGMGRWAPPAQLTLSGWTVLGLDSHVDDEPAALVDAAEFELLKAGCAEVGTDHVLIATHHPPVEVGCPWLDKDRIQNGPDLLEWMSEHSKVRAMVFGHAHQEIESTYRDIKLLGTPSTCFQFAPGSSRFAVDDQKPGYRWLSLGADGQVRSKVHRVEDFPLTIDRSGFKPPRSIILSRTSLSKTNLS